MKQQKILEVKRRMWSEIDAILDKAEQELLKIQKECSTTAESKRLLPQHKDHNQDKQSRRRIPPLYSI